MNIFKKILLVSIILTNLGFIFGINISINNLAETLKTKIQEIHFYNGPDNFPQNGLGLLIIKGIKTLNSPIILKYYYNGKNYSIKCNGQLEGRYINTMRGNFLLPIDSSSKNLYYYIGGDNKVDFTGGLYTLCDNNLNSIFGFLQYYYNGNNWFQIYAGFKFDIKNNKILFDSGFISSFQLYNGVRPVGFIYDTIGGVGFVGGEIDTGSIKPSILQNKLMDLLSLSTGINKLITDISGDKIIFKGGIVIKSSLFTILKTIIGILGAYNISNSNFKNSEEKKIITRQLFINEQNPSSSSRLGYLLGNRINVSQMLNKIKKNSYYLCRGRWEKISTNITFDSSNPLKKINCINTDRNDNIKIFINYDPSFDGYNHILVIKGGKDIKVIFNKSMQGKNFIDLYIDNGRVLINNNINKVNIDSNGYPTTSIQKTVTSGAVLKGNFFIRGLLQGYENGIITGFSHKLYIIGSVVSYNTISDPSTTRVNLVKNLLYDNNINENDINLQKIFNWRCLDIGRGTDNVNCSNPLDKWRQNSIIFIKGTFKSLLNF